MTMMMAAMRPGCLQAAILNDIGPEIDQAGLDRIKEYVGKSAPVFDWNDAADQVKALNKEAFPDYGDDDWMKFAQRTFNENEDGVPVLAYDPEISRPIDEDQSSAAPPDLWPFYDALIPVPTLLIRGALSDILSRDCVAEMVRRKPDLATLELADRGHAPMLNEPEALATIRTFLAGL